MTTDATPIDLNRYVVVPNHMYGPSIVHHGCLVDSCPNLESAERMAAALNELIFDGNLSFALPAMQALPSDEAERVMRHLAKTIRNERQLAW